MITPEDILQLAEKLYDANNENFQEVVYRAVVGRAYYATYHKALNSPKAESFDKEDKSNCHQKLIQFFNKCDDVDRKIIAKKLQLLRKLRNKADYKISTNFELSEVEKAMLEAKTTFVCLDS